jgi:UDP-GlcNAc:undecaprenyl-phosphate GlcNAc-1-phosphate transferase
MELGGLDYVAVFASTLALTLGLTPLALRIAITRGVLDHPGEIKAQDSPMPYLGGVAIVLSFAVVVIVGALVFPPATDGWQVYLIIGLAVLLALVGLLDDLRGLSPLIRLAVETGAALAVWHWSTSVQFLDNGFLDALVTTLWIVGVTNALNLLDNMDGLSAGVSAIAAVFIFALAAANGQFLVATLAAGVAGCASGFLRSNFHPARIYMGDAGALFLGFLLAVLCIRLRFDGPEVVTFAVPILLMGVPLFDTTLVTVNRLLHHRNPMAGGRDHTSHRLVFMGLSVRVAVGMIYLAAISFGALAVVASRVDQGTGLILIAWIAVMMIIVGIALSMVPVYETSSRRHLMLQEVVRHEPDLPIAIDRDAMPAIIEIDDVDP